MVDVATAAELQRTTWKRRGVFEGLELYARHCAACHGREWERSWTRSVNLTPPARSFSRRADAACFDGEQSGR